MSFDLYNPTDEHASLRRTVRDFVQREVEPQALEYNRLEKFNVPLFKRAGELGLLGLTVSPDYGGAGLDATAAVIAHEELAASDPAFTLSYLAHAMLFVNNFFVNANDDQRRRILPKVASGEWIAGMGMSEPAVGTDVLGMKTKAVRQGDTYILDGRKMWITNGCVDEHTLGDCFLIYAKTGERQVSSFVVEKGMPGFSLGQKIKDKSGMRASCTAELVLDHCEVPASNRLGNEGESMLHMMRNLEIERVTLAAMSLGIARRSLEIMVRYANDRMAFGQPLVAFGQIQRYIGDSYAKTQAARAYTYLTASRMSLDSHGNRVDSDGAKLFATTVGKEVADNAMQVLGGYGYVGEYVVERLWRDAKLLEIGGGTLEAHQKNIARDLSKAMAS